MAYTSEAKVRAAIGITSTSFLLTGEVTQAITEADNIIDKQTHVDAGAYSSSTNAFDYYVTPDNADALGRIPKVIRLKFVPPTSITSFRTYDSNRDLVDTATGDTLNDTADYWLDVETGIVTFSDNFSLPPGTIKGLRCTGTYGWASVPQEIETLSTLLATVLCLVAKAGGSYSYPATVSLDGASLSFGVPYMNFKEASNMITGKAALLDEQWQIVGKWRAHTVFSTGGSWDW